MFTSDEIQTSAGAPRKPMPRRDSGILLGEDPMRSEDTR